MTGRDGDGAYVPVTFDRHDHIEGPFFHGTKSRVEVGDHLVPGFGSNFQEGRVANNIYFAALLETAVWGAELATALAGSNERGHIYVVEPTGPFEDDPNVTNKRFPGNVTQSYRRRAIRCVWSARWRTGRVTLPKCCRGCSTTSSGSGSRGWTSSRIDVGPPGARTAREINEMRQLRYSINVTLDGCCHHEAGLPPDEESMHYWTAEMGRADALLFGRVTYEMMESAWRRPTTGTWPEWMGEWEIPFAEAIDRAKKHVVSATLSEVDWNAELVQGDLGQAVQQLKEEPGELLWVGGVTLPLALADLGLIDEYEFLVQPVLAGHGPTLLAGLRERIQLELVDRREFRSGAVAVRYRPTRVAA